MLYFNEDTRVKFPATIQFLRLGYEYQSLKGARVDFETKIFIDRFKIALEKINDRAITDEELFVLLAEINTLIKNSDLGKEFYKRLLSSQHPIKLIDLDNYKNNDFAVVNELPFSVKEGTEEGSFRPDIIILINGMPLAFLEVKHPDNSGGIQVEFERMINKRLKNDDYKKYFNLIQVITFSNNMEYEDADDDIADEVKAGSFYTTPNGLSTSFSFFRQVISNSALSASITAIQGLISNNFSLTDVGFSAAFGALGGAFGNWLSGTKWEKGIRGFMVGFGLTGLESATAFLYYLFGDKE